MDQDKIWAYYQTEGIASFSGAVGRLTYLMNQLPPKSTVLNIGVGSGEFEEKATHAGHDVYALDPIEASIVMLRQRLGLGEKAKVGYGQAIPFDNNFFDAVVVSEVFEHLSPDVMQATLAEIVRVLRVGGRLLGTVPARENLQESIIVCPHCGEQFHRWGHLQSFTPAQMHTILEEHLHVEKIIERPFITWSMYNLKGKTVSAIKMMLWWMGVHGSNERIYFCATRRK